MSEPRAMQRLERRLSLTSVVGISISAMLGSGIFVLPGLAAAKTGPSVWLAYLAAGMCVLPAALSKAELATAMPTSGGTYVYADRAFGPMIGTIAGLGLWLSLLLKAAFALVGFSAYLHVMVDVPIRTAALVLLVPIVWLNLRGVRGISRVQIAVVVITLIALAGLSVDGVRAFDERRLDDMFTHGSVGFLSAVGFVFVSFAGVTKIAAIAEEVQRPERNLPAGILLSGAIVTVLYSAVSLVLVGALDLDALAGDTSPIHTLAEVLTDWKPLAVGIAVVGVLAMTSMANAGLLAASRFPFAMSRDDLLPGGFRWLHPRYLTPVVSVFVSAGFMAASIVLFDIERIAKLASSIMIVMFMAENLAVIVLRETRTQWYRPPFRVPFYPWVQIFGLVTNAVLLVVLGPVAALGGLAIAAPGVVLYIAYGRRRTGRMGAIGKRSKRRELLASQELAAVDESERAAVVVALFGTEPSPEMLVDLGEALSEGGAIEVVHLTELPEQVGLDAVSEDRRIAGVRRRVLAMAEDRDIPLRFDAASSRDIIKTVHDICGRLDCSWLIMEWRGRSRSAFTITNPIGWLAEHLSCNLATYHDHGVRYIRKILVHVEPGPHDALVLGTADTLAKSNGAELTFAKVIGSASTADQRQAAADYLDQVRDVSSARSEVLVLEGDKIYEALARESDDYDLLITPARPRSSVFQVIRGTGLDKLAARAVCSVLRLQAPETTSHEAFERYRSTAAGERRFIDYVHPECSAARLVHHKKDALFAEVAATFAARLDGITAETIIAGLWERERTQNTALRDGMALPHATLAEVDRTYLGVFTTHKAIDYDAPDGRGVDVFFVTIGAPGDRNQHLVLLGSIAKLVKQTDLLERLRAAHTSAEIHAALRECSDEIDI